MNSDTFPTSDGSASLFTTGIYIFQDISLEYVDTHDLS